MSVGVAFITAGVEFFETAAIAYAISRAGYTREAIVGTSVGLGLVTGIALYSWRSLERIPFQLLHVGVGVILCGVGGWWAMKAIRKTRKHQRSRWISAPLSEANFELQRQDFSSLNCLLMAKSAAIEGFEVAVIVVGLGVTSRAWFEVVFGTAAAFAATLATVIVLHGRLRQIPENAIKLGTGLVLLAIGAIWVAESARRFLP
jgi:uncharacterized membrane protein